MTISGAILYVVVVVGLSILGMVHGWGLEPKSWGWILGSYLGIFITAMVQAATTELQK